MSTLYTEDPAKQRTLMRERSKYLAAERKETEKIRKEARSLQSCQRKKSGDTVTRNIVIGMVALVVLSGVIYNKSNGQ